MIRPMISLVLCALVGCSAATPAPAPAPAPVVNRASPGPMAGPGPMLESPPRPACPDDLKAAEGQSCTSEGAWCAGAKTDKGLLCQHGAWQRGEPPHPPCCKR